MNNIGPVPSKDSLNAEELASSVSVPNKNLDLTWSDQEYNLSKHMSNTKYWGNLSWISHVEAVHWVVKWPPGSDVWYWKLGTLLLQFYGS